MTAPRVTNPPNPDRRDVPRTARTDDNRERVRTTETPPNRVGELDRSRVSEDQTARPRPERVGPDPRNTRENAERIARGNDRTNAARREVQENLRSALRRSADNDGRDRDRDIARDGDRSRNDDRFRNEFRRWDDRGDRIRSNFRRGDYFTTSWWRGRPVIGFGFGPQVGYGGRGSWGYQPWLGYQPYGYWWGRPSWQSLAGWFGGYGGYGWNDPYYYDYGPGGNVVYYTDYVAVNGQNVGTPSSFYEAARDLASVDPSELDANDRDWQPLGTFSMAVRQDEVDPDRVVQLAVNKQGVVSGTVFNRKSGNLYNVQGRIDPATQRVAFTIGNDRNTVFETGLYNLTQDQTPILVHFSARQQETYMLARLPEPESGVERAAAALPTNEVAR